MENQFEFDLKQENGQQERQVAVFNGVEAEWSPEAEAWLYKVPDTTLVLYWDETQGQYLPLAIRGSYLARERVSAVAPDGTKLYRERIYLREPEGITPESIELQRLLIQAKRREFLLRTWDNLIAFSWTVPLMLAIMVGSFLWSVAKALTVYSAVAAMKFGEALSFLAYYGTLAIGAFIALLVLVCLAPSLLRSAWRTGVMESAPADYFVPTVSRPATGGETTNTATAGNNADASSQNVNIVINQTKFGAGSAGNSNAAQDYIK